MCWRSACIIIGDKRVVTLNRITDDRTNIEETDPTWYNDWYDPQLYVEPPDRIRQEVLKRLQELHL